MKMTVRAFICLGVFIFLLIAFSKLSSSATSVYTSNVTGARAFSCTSSSCTPLPSNAPPAEKPFALSKQTNRTGNTNIASKDGAGAAITAKFGYVYLVIDLNSLNVSDLGQITNMNFTGSAWSDTSADPNITAFTFNYVTQSWTQCGDKLTGDSNSINQTSCVSTNLNMVNQTTNETYFMLQKSGNTSSTGTIDSLSVEVTTASVSASYVNPTDQTGKFFNRNYIPVNVTASSSLAIDSIVIRLFNATGSLIRNNLSTSSSFFINYSGLSDGFYRFNATVNDSSGSNNFLETRNITLDSINPTMNILAPPQLSNSSSSSVQITYSTFDVNPFACWWTNNTGVSNTSVTCGVNITASFADGLKTVIVYANDSAGNTNSSSVTFRVDTTAPSLNLIVPGAFQEFNFNTSISLNYTISDSGIGLASCWYHVDSNANITIPSCANSTFNTSEGSHTIFLYSNDSVGNRASQNNVFSVSQTAPAISLQYPLNNSFFMNGTNIRFNWTAIDSNGISACQVWHDLSGTFKTNLTRADITSGVMASQTYNVTSDNKYNWNVFCNDTTNAGKFGNNNLTFILDTVKPTIIIDNIGTSAGSQNVRFNHTASDTYLNACFYAVLNSSGGYDTVVHPGGLNTSMTCNSLNTIFTVSDVGSYTLLVYANDSAGNVEVASNNFSVSSVGASPGSDSGGGGGSIIILNPGSAILSTNFSIVTTNLQNVLDLVVAKNSIRPRTKELIIINKGKEQITVTLACDTTLVNQSELQGVNQDIDICDYVYFDQEIVSVSGNELEPALVKVYVYTPEGASYFDKYLFNVIAINELDDKTQLFSKLSVSVRTPLWGRVLGWSPFSKMFDLVTLNWDREYTIEDRDKKAYPVFWVSLVLAIIVFSMTLATFTVLRKRENRMPVTGFLGGLALFFTVLVTLIFVL